MVYWPNGLVTRVDFIVTLSSILAGKNALRHVIYEHPLISKLWEIRALVQTPPGLPKSSSI